MMTITEEQAFEKDVKSMSYDELMETIRYLDEERQKIADRVHNRADDDHKGMRTEVAKRAA